LGLTSPQQIVFAASLASAAALSIATWLISMRMGVKALERMGDA
jgi:hypothetical protein